MTLIHAAYSQSPTACVNDSSSLMAALGLIRVRGSNPCCSFVVSNLLSPNSAPEWDKVPEDFLKMKSQK